MWFGYIKSDGTCLLTPLFPNDQGVWEWCRGDALVVCDLSGGLELTKTMAKKNGANSFIVHDPAQNVNMKPVTD
ncbi:MAG: hypothetical protein MI923_06470 [Phycisphaerales bacterium]|nr:hypothetical protein [Phycisphaerales bacterium]